MFAENSLITAVSINLLLLSLEGYTFSTVYYFHHLFHMRRPVFPELR